MARRTELEKNRRRNARTIKRIALGGSKNKKNNVVYLILSGALLLFILFVTLNHFVIKSDSLPTWNDIFGLIQNSSGDDSGITGKNSAKVHFIDVGQGDSQLIVTEDYNILIDSGENEYSSTVISYLQNLGIKKLDYIICSHPHSDHIGGMYKIITKFEVGKLIMPKLTDEMVPTTSCYTKLIKAISNYNIKTEYAVAGTSLTLGDNCRIDILAPVKDYDDLNNYSVVFKFINGDNKFLFCGDIESIAEKDIAATGVDLTADVLKVPHHGSSTSSKTSFLKKIEPKIGVIGVGSPNTYNHPNKTVIERYDDFNIKILRTDLNGNIVFTSNGKDLTFECSKNNNINESNAA